MVEEWVCRRPRLARTRRGARLLALVDACAADTDLPLAPLLVSCLLSVARRDPARGRALEAVHAAYARLLLDRCALHQGAAALLNAPHKLRLLGCLAQDAERSGAGSLQRGRAQDVLARHLRRGGLQSASAAEVLERVGVRSGLLQPAGPDGVTFLSESMRCYLQAQVPEGDAGSRSRRGPGASPPDPPLPEPPDPAAPGRPRPAHHPGPATHGGEPPALEVSVYGAATATDASCGTGLLDAQHDLFWSRLLLAARRMGAAPRVTSAERDEVVSRLLRLFWQSPFELLQREALASLRWLGDELVPDHFRQALQCSSPYVRTRAAEALGRLACRTTAGALRPGVRDAAWQVRLHAAEGLGRLHDPGAWGDLVGLLHDPHWRVQVAAADALGWLRTPEAAPPVCEALVRGYESAQYAASRLFTRLGLPVAAELPWKAGQDQDLAVRSHLAEALGRIAAAGGPDVLPGLLDHGDPAVRCGAASALVRVRRTEALPVLAQGCQSPAADDRYRAALCASYVPLVTGTSYQSDERQPMGALVPLLTDLLQDPVWKVRGAAAAALGSLQNAAWAAPVGSCCTTPATSWWPTPPWRWVWRVARRPWGR
ncbi:MAG: HEAT repeat domain-containing protein [Candidatus Latescibacterota bacterium]